MISQQCSAKPVISHCGSIDSENNSFKPFVIWNSDQILLCLSLSKLRCVHRRAKMIDSRVTQQFVCAFLLWNRKIPHFTARVVRSSTQRSQFSDNCWTRLNKPSDFLTAAKSTNASLWAPQLTSLSEMASRCQRFNASRSQMASMASSHFHPRNLNIIFHMVLAIGARTISGLLEEYTNRNRNYVHASRTHNTFCDWTAHSWPLRQMHSGINTDKKFQHQMNHSATAFLTSMKLLIQWNIWLWPFSSSNSCISISNFLCPFIYVNPNFAAQVFRHIRLSN